MLIYARKASLDPTRPSFLPFCFCPSRAFELRHPPVLGNSPKSRELPLWERQGDQRKVHLIRSYRWTRKITSNVRHDASSHRRPSRSKLISSFRTTFRTPISPSSYTSHITIHEHVSKRIRTWTFDFRSQQRGRRAEAVGTAWNARGR